MTKQYQPLATKYRPQTFEDVVGQEVATTTLRNAISSKRISHAYLFSGMRGVGKTTAARILAKCLNCRNADEPTVSPCGECESCTEVAAGRSIDVLEIDGASNTSVDDVRALQENLIYAPARDRYKVYIVDEVHMLSKSAFNAFLKTLEEPPKHVVFIFATTEMNRIPPTVLSRCLVFDFGRVNSKAIADRLKWICAGEEVNAEEAAIDLIVFQSEGSIRDAISALDQVINFSGGDVTYDQALQALGLIDRDVLHQLMGAVIEQNAESAFDVIRKVSDAGADMRLFCRHLIRHIRDLLMVKIGGKNRELLPYSEDEKNLLAEQSKRLSEEDLSRFFDILVKADEEMQFASTPQYHLEAATVKMIHSTRLKPLAELIANLSSAQLPQPSVMPRQVPREQNLDFGIGAKPAATQVSGSPKEKLLFASRDMDVHSFVKMAASVALEGSQLLITVNSSMEVKVLSQEPKRGELKQAAHEAFGDGITVEVNNGGSRSDLSEDDDEKEEPAPPVAEADIPAETAEEKEQPYETRQNQYDDPELAEIEKKLKQHPLAGKLFEELPLKINKVREFKDEENEQ